MKALSVTQPWASILCAGLKDVENRKWQAAKAPGRILIHATKTKVPSYYEQVPDDYTTTIKNARLMGWIPEYSDMPYGSIIGYLDCYQIIKDSDSFWAQPDYFHWCVKDAYLFDEPIPGINGVRGHLFDVDIDENNLPPAHQVQIMEPELKGTHLIMPASNAVIADIEAGAIEIVYGLCITNEWLFLDEKGIPYDIKTVEFVGKDKTIKKDIQKIEPFSCCNPDGEEIHYTSIDGQDSVWSGIALIFQ